MSLKLYDYQREAVQRIEEAYIANPHGGYFLALDVGTGKSVTSVTWLTQRKLKALIVCPKSVIGVWGREIAKHYPHLNLKVNNLIGTSAQKIKALDPTADVWVTNYQTLLTPKILEDLPYEVVVFDESQNIKSPTAKISKQAAKMTQDKFTLCLSGTPAPKDPSDWWAQFYTIDPEIFDKNFYSFKATFCRLQTINLGSHSFDKVIGSQNQELLASKMSSHISKVARDDVLELPDIEIREHQAQLSLKESNLLKTFMKDRVVEIEEAGEFIVEATIAPMLLRVRQWLGGGAKSDEGVMIKTNTAKIDMLETLIESSQEPYVVVCQFKNSAEQVEKLCKKLHLRYGEVSGARKDGITDKSEFNTDCDVIAVQWKAGSVGIDLTYSRRLVIYDLTYVGGDWEQMLARVHRPPQSRKVVVDVLLGTYSDGTATLDNTVYKACTERLKTSEAFSEMLKKVKKDLGL